MPVCLSTFFIFTTSSSMAHPSPRTTPARWGEGLSNPWEHHPVTPSQCPVLLAPGALAEGPHPAVCPALHRLRWLWPSEPGLHPFPEPVTSRSLSNSTHWTTLPDAGKSTPPSPARPSLTPHPPALGHLYSDAPWRLRQVPNRLPACPHLFLPPLSTTDHPRGQHTGSIQCTSHYVTLV